MASPVPVTDQITPTPPPDALARLMMDAWAAYLTRGARGPASPHATVYASAWRVCDRRMTYELTQPGTLPPYAADVLARFRRGDDRERDLLADLARVGRDTDPPFAVIGQQERFTLKDRKGRIAISGKVDARIAVHDRRAPLEIKAWSPFLVDRIETFADLFDNPWTRGGAHQLLAYLYGAAEPFGFLLLDRSGLPLLLPVELEAHLDRVEDFLTKAERVIDHVQAGTLPDYLPDDPSECKRCPWFGGVCNPPLSATGAVVLTDPELEAQLTRREEIKSIGKEFLDVDRAVKDKLRGVVNGIVGPFSITGKWSKQSTLELPADLKKQYTRTIAQGRFSLQIEKLGS
jgi:hypothetical protein